DINITVLYFLQIFKHIYLQQVITSVIMQNDNKTDIQSVTSYKMLIYLVFKENDTERSVTVE
ncbi:hypothetical protein MMJ21_08595, partial [Enterococcus cecorum]|uniref:hypothetical protein n=1 Tax=Enterococcus cecorum TaxID=44008 RepID=UPI001FACA646